MPDQLLNLLKIFLLVLLYLFLLRVLRAVWAEINPPRPATAPAATAAAGQARPGGQRGARRPQAANVPPHLRVVEPAAIRGQQYMLGAEATLGRAAGCQIPLEDSYASQVHARVYVRDGQWYIEDMGSTNGTYLNRRRVAGPMVMNRRDRIQIGNTVLELS